MNNENHSAAAPPPPARTREETDALQTSTRETLIARCRRLSEDEAIALLKARGVVPEWLGDREAPDGVFLHEGPLTLGLLRLDEGEAALGAGGLIVDGDLEVDGIENGEQDFGPFLIVLGKLTVGNAALGGATLEVTGDLHVRGAFHGYYNHGQTRVHGQADVALLVIDDYSFICGGTIRGAVLDQWNLIDGKPQHKVTLEETLHPAFIERDDDGDARIASHALFHQLVFGGAIKR